MFTTRMLRGGGLRVLTLLPVLIASLIINPVSVQAAEVDDIGLFSNSLADPSAMITDGKGRTYRVSSSGTTGTVTMEYLQPFDTENVDGKAPAGITYTNTNSNYAFTDEKGVIHYLYRESDKTASTTVSFKPNMTIELGNGSFLTDTSGNLWYLSNAGGTLSVTAVKNDANKQIKTKANISVKADTAHLITDNSGQIWKLNGGKASKVTYKGDAAMLPNQFERNAVTDGGFYYVNKAGVLISPLGDSSKVTGLTPGTLVPVYNYQTLLIADGGGTLWYVGGSGESRQIAGAKFAPGTYAPGSPFSSKYFWAVDTQGFLYQGGYSKLTKLSNIKFSVPNRITLSFETGSDSGDATTVAFAGSEDGTIYELVGPFSSLYSDGSGVEIKPTGLMWKTSGSQASTTIACAPTTGVAPDGLSRYGLVSLFIGMLALGVLTASRKRLAI